MRKNFIISGRSPCTPFSFQSVNPKKQNDQLRYMVLTSLKQQVLREIDTMMNKQRHTFGGSLAFAQHCRQFIELLLSDTSGVSGVVELDAALCHDVNVLHEILDVYALGDYLQLQQKEKNLQIFRQHQRKMTKTQQEKIPRDNEG